MAFHPSLNVEIARQRDEELLVRGESQRLVEVSLPGRDLDRRALPIRTISGRGWRQLVAKRANA